jgi:UDP-N-acetylglucosamine/UDP-N-acetylgalactosamine diphosphorylase
MNPYEIQTGPDSAKISKKILKSIRINIISLHFGGENMDIQPRCYDKVIQLINKGVDVPNPLTLDLGDEVRVDQISGDGVKIYPGWPALRVKRRLSQQVAGLAMKVRSPLITASWGPTLN